MAVSPPKSSLEIAAYAPGGENRPASVHIQRDQPTIWPILDPYGVRNDQLKQHERVVLLKATRTGDCRWRQQRTASAKAAGVTFWASGRGALLDAGTGTLAS